MYIEILDAEIIPGYQKLELLSCENWSGSEFPE